MRKIFQVFVAGSKDLKQERDALRVVVQKLNTLYNDQNIDVFVELKSYEEFKDKQVEYEAYIREKADMVVFVLDGHIGEFTTQELKVAAEASKQKKKLPEIVVYLKEFNEETEEIRHIQNTLKNILDDHFYVEYKDLDNLRTKVSERIRKAVNSADHTRSMKKWRMISIFIAIASLLLMGGLTYYSMNKLQKKQEETKVVHFDDEPMLLFLGGGSVANFLSEKFYPARIDHMESVGGFHNTMYLGLPTGDLWSIIGEEYYKEYFNKDKVDKYYPVFLAAKPIDMKKVKNAILEDNLDIRNKMLIYQLELGEDPIITYFTGDSVLTEGVHYYMDKGRKCQNEEQLKKTIDFAFNNDDVLLYTTTLPSGTWDSYKEVLLKHSDIITKVENNDSCRMVFNDSKSVSGKKYGVVLGSYYYHPKNPIFTNDNKIFVHYRAINNKLIPKTKKLYIYFIAYAKLDSNGQPEYYRIPNQVKRFLDCIETKATLVVEDKFRWNKKDDDDVWRVEVTNLPSDGLIEMKAEFK
ncbi:MAG: hypothetical protein IJS43_03845 [Bacteroidaceae bacterium]|nr:hypothetical protein [Bacteroidaceae bacterium]